MLLMKTKKMLPLQRPLPGPSARSTQLVPGSIESVPMFGEVVISGTTWQGGTTFLEVCLRYLFDALLENNQELVALERAGNAQIRELLRAGKQLRKV